MSFKIRRALISVYDKEGIIELAQFLSKNSVEIISSGGTAEILNKNNIKVTQVTEFTKSPEMLDGRIKTLHPKIHGAVLADKNNKSHLEQAKKEGIELIDIVVINLYPFEESILNGANLSDAIEKIDVGGPALIRAAAKNYKSVAVVSNKNQYTRIIEELKSQDMHISEKTLENLAISAWTLVSHYDVIIEKYFRKKFGFDDEFAEYLNLTFHKKQDLRYGENPHQRAAVYKDDHYKNPSVLDAVQHQGKQLSYNNVLDCNSAFKLIREFNEPTAVIVKHNNPCGVASAKDILTAYKRAKAVDPEAAFGGVVAINKEVDISLSKEIISRFVEIVMAPSFTKEALEVFAAKPNMRVMETTGVLVKRLPYRKYRSILGGLLVQEANVKMLEETKIVTKRKPTQEEMNALIYAWKIVKYVKSNAIVYARENNAVGIGAGQMKRIDAAKLAAMIATDNGETLKGCVMASDAFFPFRDGIDYAASIGITAIIQPGGSIKDEEVIKAANEHGIAMVFTGVRHFRH